MKQDIQYTEKFLKGLTTLTGLPYKKVQQYVKGNNPIVSGTSYSSMAEKGILPHQCKSTANYEEIVLGPIPAEEKRNRFQYSR